MKYASEAIYRVTAWLEPEDADDMAKEFDCAGYNNVVINGVDKIEVVFETTDGNERDRACAWLEDRR